MKIDALICVCRLSTANASYWHNAMKLTFCTLTFRIRSWLFHVWNILQSCQWKWVRPIPNTEPQEEEACQHSETSQQYFQSIMLEWASLYCFSSPGHFPQETKQINRTTSLKKDLILIWINWILFHVCHKRKLEEAQWTSMCRRSIDAAASALYLLKIYSCYFIIFLLKCKEMNYLLCYFLGNSRKQIFSLQFSIHDPHRTMQGMVLPSGCRSSLTTPVKDLISMCGRYCHPGSLILLMFYIKVLRLT